jgi:SAM-dependent methyltransferase
MTGTYELARCLVCDEADTREIAGPEELRAEAERLWEFHMRRLSPRTPPERLVDRVAFSQRATWRIVQCRRCGLVYRNPAEKRDAVVDAYADAVSTGDALRALHDAQRASYRTQARRLARQVERRGTGLEVGSYVGAFLGAARETGWQFEGLDINAHVNAFTRSLGFTVHDGDLERFESERVFDAVAIWNTFDQLPDPRTAAQVARRLLRPNGVLAVRVPNGEFYVYWRTRLETPGLSLFATAALAHNNLLTFPYRFGFTPGTLARLLRDTGFRVAHTVREVLVPTADEWTRPWARAESALVKAATKPAAPWFEVYACRAND